MYSIKYLVPLWVGIGLYTFFALLKGPVGIDAYRQLAAEKEKLQSNMEELQRINKELELTKDSLLYDKETIAVYARDLGYKTERERFVRVVGFEGAKKQPIEPGQLRVAAAPEYIAEKAIKICAFLIGVGAFLCMLIPDVLQRKTERLQSRRPQSRRARVDAEPEKGTPKPRTRSASAPKDADSRRSARSVAP